MKVVFSQLVRFTRNGVDCKAPTGSCLLRRISTSQGPPQCLLMLRCFLSMLCLISAGSKYYIMESLDQVLLRTNLEVPRLICPGWESNPGLRGGRRTLEQKKSHPNRLLRTIRNIYICARDNIKSYVQ